MSSHFRQICQIFINMSPVLSEGASFDCVTLPTVGKHHPSRFDLVSFKLPLMNGTHGLSNTLNNNNGEYPVKVPVTESEKFDSIPRESPTPVSNGPGVHDLKPVHSEPTQSVSASASNYDFQSNSRPPDAPSTAINKKTLDQRYCASRVLGLKKRTDRLLGRLNRLKRSQNLPESRTLLTQDSDATDSSSGSESEPELLSVSREDLASEARHLGACNWLRAKISSLDSRLAKLASLREAVEKCDSGALSFQHRLGSCAKIEGECTAISGETSCSRTTAHPPGLCTPTHRRATVWTRQQLAGLLTRKGLGNSLPCSHNPDLRCILCISGRANPNSAWPKPVAGDLLTSLDECNRAASGSLPPFSEDHKQKSTLGEGVVSSLYSSTPSSNLGFADLSQRLSAAAPPSVVCLTRPSNRRRRGTSISSSCSSTASSGESRSQRSSGSGGGLNADPSLAASKRRRKVSSGSNGSLLPPGCCWMETGSGGVSGGVYSHNWYSSAPSSPQTASLQTDSGAAGSCAEFTMRPPVSSYKQIVVPEWREATVQTSGLHSVLTTQDLSNDDVDGGSRRPMEDMSDAAFLERHRRSEQLERQRFIKMQQIVTSLNCSSAPAAGPGGAVGGGCGAMTSHPSLAAPRSERRPSMAESEGTTGLRDDLYQNSLDNNKLNLASSAPAAVLHHSTRQTNNSGKTTNKPSAAVYAVRKHQQQTNRTTSAKPVASISSASSASSSSLFGRRQSLPPPTHPLSPLTRQTGVESCADDDTPRPWAPRRFPLSLAEYETLLAGANDDY